jgi:murein DD-endopeptidase MepM/ murein hydrolase activator NlpD
MIVIKHGGGLYSKLMHLKELPNVSVGNTVSTGDTIGKVGTTGNAEETDQPHVHWEIRQGGFSKTDPSVDPTGCLT